ncbi:MAG TPA: hypothetical protein VJ777_13500 [Mycobacterium sp.]|nr:hypothetical protein [Mycobacterium sp.]
MATVEQIVSVLDGAATIDEAVKRLQMVGLSVTEVTEVGFVVGAVVDVVYTGGSMLAGPRWTAWLKSDPVKTRQTVKAGRRLTRGPVAEEAAGEDRPIPE